MADEPIYAGGGSKAVIAAGTYNFLELLRETDRGRVVAGSLATGAGVLLSATLGLATVALSVTGSTTLALKCQYDRHTVLVTVAAGAGAYTADVILPQSVTGADGVSSIAFGLGDVVEMRIEVAASVNPTLRIWHNAASGTALATLTGEAAGARNYIGSFRHNGTAWVLWDIRQVNA
jgi:hypothetical protein